MFALIGVLARMLEPDEYVCGAMLIDPDYPPNLWYSCALGPNHDHVHRAIGATPEWTWGRTDPELHEIDWWRDVR